MESSAGSWPDGLKRTEPFDILVVGGGITGAGIARDAAMRGYATALIEKGDFASGTSSKSTKLVHGGVRYLELFQFGLVFEASRERKVLWEIAPELARPVPFLFPAYCDARWPAWMINAGLWMYDALSLYRNYRNHQWLSNREITELMRGFDVRNINGGARYWDGQVEDARLVLENVRSGCRYGARAASYFQADGFLYEKNRGRDRISGVRGHHVLSGEIREIHSRLVVNAAGVWSDEVAGMDEPGAPRRMRPTKGIHILVPWEKIGGDSAVAFPNVTDGRLMFIVPWGGFQIIGTTDTDYAGDLDRVSPERGEVDYIIAAANHAFPGSPIRLEDVVGAYAGLRPLVQQEAKSEEQTSREHEIWTSPSGLLSIAGGKLTTYRSMAEELVDLAAVRLRREFGLPEKGPCRTAKVPLIEAGPETGRGIPGEAADVPEDVIDHLRHHHGPEYADVLKRAGSDPVLRERIVEGLPYIWAEVPYAAEREMAKTLADLFERRIRLILESRDGGLAAAGRAARLLGGCLGWDEKKLKENLRDYEARVGRENAWKS